MKKEKIKKIKIPVVYKGIIYDSEYERLFVLWLEEAILQGYVLRYKFHPDPIVLQDSESRIFETPGKKGPLQRKETLFKKVIYTPDFIIIWNDKAVSCGLVMCLENKTRKMTNHPFVAQITVTGAIRSIIDVKPPTKMGGANASYRDLAIKRPLIWKLKGYYIQAIVPINPKKISECLFSRTWAPKVYLERPRADGKGFLMNYCENKTIKDYEKESNI